MKIGVGVVTYGRPDYFRKCIHAVEKQLPKVVDHILVYNDGSEDDRYLEIYDEMSPSIELYHPLVNRGVAIAKNWLLEEMMSHGCDFMFLLEDDIIIKSPKAVTEYVRLSQESGIEHLMFAHHGPANAGKDKLLHSHNGIDLWRNGVGAWALYTKNVIKQAGLFDQNFKNAWEHIEHTHRIAKAGLTAPWGCFADISDSKNYLAEIPGSIEGSVIRPRGEWLDNVINGLIYWRDTRPDFPLGHILDNLMQEEEKLKKEVIA
jgi:glycosyltransferase involved in cell wall biosynthesis